jgi:hypothetical protein
MDAAFLLLQGVLQTYEAGTGAGRNAMKLGIHCVRTYLVFRSFGLLGWMPGWRARG